MCFSWKPHSWLKTAKKQSSGELLSWNPIPELALSLSAHPLREGGVCLENLFCDAFQAPSLLADGFHLPEHWTPPVTKTSPHTRVASTDLCWKQSGCPICLEKKNESLLPALLCLWNFVVERAFWAALLCLKTEVPEIKPFFLFLRLHLKVNSLWGDVRQQQCNEAV